MSNLPGLHLFAQYNLHGFLAGPAFGKRPLRDGLRLALSADIKIRLQEQEETCLSRAGLISLTNEVLIFFLFAHSSATHCHAALQNGQQEPLRRPDDRR